MPVRTYFNLLDHRGTPILQKSKVRHREAKVTQLVRGRAGSDLIF